MKYSRITPKPSTTFIWMPRDTSERKNCSSLFSPRTRLIQPPSPPLTVNRVGRPTLPTGQSTFGSRDPHFWPGPTMNRVWGPRTLQINGSLLVIGGVTFDAVATLAKLMHPSAELFN